LELVYLWVEDYKNIKKQGFNFSPRFHCEFKAKYEKDENGKEVLKDNCKLVIKENDDYIENFFGDNINVTAIIGKNGSGKSSIIEYINSILNSSDKKYILVFETNQIYYSSNLKIITPLKKNEGNNIKYFIYANEINCRTQISLIKYDIYKMMVANYLENRNFQLSSFMYIPDKIKIIECYFEDKFYESLYRYDPSNDGFIFSKDKKKNLNLMNNYEEILKEMESKITNNYHRFLLIWYVENIEINPFVFENKDFLEQEYKKNSFLTFEENDIEKYFMNNQNIIKNINSLSIQEKEIYFELNEYIDFFELDFIDDKNRHYSHLSHGEKTLFGQLLNIYHYSYMSEEKNILFLFDEPELSLHPDWQKKYLQEIYTLLTNLNKKFHLILTSHSPFLLSDIPKQNIIFLDKDEKGNCKVVDGLKEKKQTFGANIHTLLSDSFFMEDGLMGKFAKSKIDKAIELLNQEQLNEDELKYCEQIISIIGEPIVKNQLQRMLEMQQRLDELEK